MPAGSQPGKLLKVKGRGAPKPKGGKGDLLARVKLTVPEKVSKQERELLEEPGRAADGCAPLRSISVAAELVGMHASRRCACTRRRACPSAADARRHAATPRLISSGCASSSG